MFTQLQFFAVGAFLLWGLASALCDVLLPDDSVSLKRQSTDGRPSADSTTPGALSVKQ